MSRSEGLLFTEDIAFNSSSAAATAVLGRNVSGPAEWRDPEGRPLREILEVPPRRRLHR